MALRIGNRQLGKLGKLGWLLLAHGPALEADFAQHFGVALCECSVRRAWVLASNLPRDSRVALLLDEATAWGPTEHLLAAVIDSIAHNTWVLAAANSKTPPPTPKPIPRPGDANKPPMVSGRQLASLLA